MKCDFYIPRLKKFVEITSFKNQKKTFGDPHFWIKYLKKIAKKKKIATQNNFTFEFIQTTISPNDIEKVQKY